MNLRRLEATAAAIALAAEANPARGAEAGAAPDIGWALSSPFDSDARSFLILYAALMLLVWMATWLLRDIARTSDRRPDMRDLSDVELAYCVGGVGRAADTFYVALASRGVARLDGARKIVVEGPSPGLTAQLEAFRAALIGVGDHRAFLKAFADCPPFTEVRRRLLSRKILLDPARRTWLDFATCLPGAALIIFGMVEVVIGRSRDEPVGPLLVLMLVDAVAIVAVRGTERYLTREAYASIDAMRVSRDRALRAPSPGELAFAVAMLGAAALDGTPHAAYAKLARPRDGCFG